jgi:hypothetical protein
MVTRAATTSSNNSSNSNASYKDTKEDDGDTLLAIVE